MNKAIDLALNYKPYKLGGRNLECCPEDQCCEVLHNKRKSYKGWTRYE